MINKGDIAGLVGMVASELKDNLLEKIGNIPGDPKDL